MVIECLVCKETKGEEYFPNSRYGGLSICTSCKDTEAAREFQAKADENAKLQWELMDKHNREREERIRNQSYEGEYDWMGEY